MHVHYGSTLIKCCFDTIVNHISLSMYMYILFKFKSSLTETTTAGSGVLYVLWIPHRNDGNSPSRAATNLTLKVFSQIWLYTYTYTLTLLLVCIEVI